MDSSGLTPWRTVEKMFSAFLTCLSSTTHVATVRKTNEWTDEDAQEKGEDVSHRARFQLNSSVDRRLTLRTCHPSASWS